MTAPTPETLAAWTAAARGIVPKSFDVSVEACAEYLRVVVAQKPYGRAFAGGQLLSDFPTDDRDAMLVWVVRAVQGAYKALVADLLRPYTAARNAARDREYAPHRSRWDRERFASYYAETSYELEEARRRLGIEP